MTTPSKTSAVNSPARADAFLEELKTLRRQIDASLGPADLEHLEMIERLGKTATAVGLATAWALPNPVSMVALALGRSTRWLLMHHIGHRGYDKVPNVPARYTSKVFARGKRRFVDWADWMIPEAWIYEHNVLHHSHTGEERDPDLIERNAQTLREAKVPMAAKYVGVGFLGLTWRAFYYAPNTFRTWMNRHEKDESKQNQSHDAQLWLRCFLPYSLINFVALPAAYLPLGPIASWSALVNSLGAEALTNLHTFGVVGPNHTGEDIYRFDTRPRNKADSMVRQVIGSVNYATGSDAIDYGHLWLNYQIEHHIYPDLPMLKYREIQPQIKALCAKYEIPYVQESVFTRIKKMVDIAVGKTSMKRQTKIASMAATMPRMEKVTEATELQMSLT